MAYFEEFHERKRADSSSSHAHTMAKMPLKRFEPALHKFTKIAIPTDLERLGLHKHNIEEYYKSHSWRELNVEQINASRTVQQLKANIKEMDNTRRQVQDSDLEKFDERVAPVKEEAVEAIKSFRQVQCLYSRQPGHSPKKQTVLDGGQSASQNTPDDNQVSPSQSQEQLQSDRPDDASVASWDSLRDNLVELNELIHDFSDVVKEQQTSIDSIVENVETAQVNVEEGTMQLASATKMKALMLPVIGATIGGIFGGPVGMFAGFKAAGIAASMTGFGAVGFTVGKVIKNKNDDAVDIELKNLEDAKTETE